MRNNQGRMTFADAEAVANRLGFSLSRSDYNDFRLADRSITNVKEREASAYYSTDLTDIIGTAEALRNRDGLVRT